MRKLTESIVMLFVLAACGSDDGTEAAEAPATERPEAGTSAPAATTPTTPTAGKSGTPPTTPSRAGADAAPSRPATAGSGSQTTPPKAGSSAMAGSTAAPSGGTSGESGADNAAEGGAGAAGSAGAATDPATGGSGVPCDASKALAAACHRCHGTVPANGAPMSLVTLEDFQTLTVAGKPRVPKYQAALNRMNGTKSPPMPPASTPITDEDKQTLIDWFGEGAPAGEPCP